LRTIRRIVEKSSTTKNLVFGSAMNYSNDSLRRYRARRPFQPGLDGVTGVSINNPCAIMHLVVYQPKSGAHQTPRF
jgi:hypothetical protein